MGSVATKLVVWLALMTLLALTVAATFAPLGPFRLAVSLAIATAKAGLIYWFYMELRTADGVQRLAALIALFMLAILLVVGGLDFAVRSGALHLA
jgi:cytochrome c oxidase subunit 4